MARLLNNHTKGMNSRTQACIGRTTRTAICSGADMPSRLGIRSANSTNKAVTVTKDSRKLTRSTQSAEKTRCSAWAK